MQSCEQVTMLLARFGRNQASGSAYERTVSAHLLNGTNVCVLVCASPGYARAMNSNQEADKVLEKHSVKYLLDEDLKSDDDEVRVVSVRRSLEASRDDKAIVAGGAGGYDDHTVRSLLYSMKTCGYNDRGKQKRSRRELFQAVVRDAKEKYGVHRTAEAWERKYLRLKNAYSAYIGKLRKSGRDADDSGLFAKPPFYAELHELEHGSARHILPAAMSSELPFDATVHGQAPSSSRKRARAESAKALYELERNQQQRHDALLLELRESNAQKRRLNDILDEYLKRN